MRVIALVGILALLAACGQDRAAQEEAARDKAKAAADELMRVLGSELKAALQQGGPEAGIRVCSEVAQRLTAEIGEKHGVSIRRTSLRVRNPLNVPNEWEQAGLRGLATDPDGIITGIGRTHTQEHGHQEVQYLKGIRLQALCVQCHGDPAQITEGVRSLIAERYPEDQAVGFKPGDLRGAVSVRVPLE